MIEKLTKENINSVNLNELSNYLNENIEIKQYFLGEPGSEHYKLLAYISTLFTDSLLFDIGTFRGASALALSYNKNNMIYSYDIVNDRILEDTENMVFVLGNVLDNPDLLKAKFISLDVNHDGVFETEFINFLNKNNWHGWLMLDDIIHFIPVKEIFEALPNEKYDISNIGHWSGTGLVKM